MSRFRRWCGCRCRGFSRLRRWRIRRNRSVSRFRRWCGCRRRGFSRLRCRRGTRCAGFSRIRCRRMGRRRGRCGYWRWSRFRLLNAGLRNRRYGGCRYGHCLHCGGSWCGACGSELESAQCIGNNRTNQADRNAKCNPRDTSHPALTSAPIRRRVGHGWKGITVRLRKADTSRSSATTAAANAPRARASWGMFVVPVRSLCHALPLADYSQGNAPPNCQPILIPYLSPSARSTTVG